MDNRFRLFLFCGLFALGVSLGIIGGFVRIAMIGEINRKLPEAEQIGYFGAHIGKALRVQNAYKKFYPKGKLLHLFNALLVTGMLLVGSSVAVLFRVFH